jgi:hypothetical protein
MEHGPRVISRPTSVDVLRRAGYNLIRWSIKFGGLVEEDTLAVAQTLRIYYFSVPARLVNRSGKPTLRGPTQWPWATS